MDNAYEDWIEDVIKKFLVDVLPPSVHKFPHHVRH